MHQDADLMDTTRLNTGQTRSSVDLDLCGQPHTSAFSQKNKDETSAFSRTFWTIH